MVINQSQNIFKRVAVSERKALFRSICQAKVNLSLKTSDGDDVFHLQAIQTEKDETLLCHHTADSKDKSGIMKVLANFIFEEERYFFQTDLEFSTGWAILKTDVDLFMLQRRANARIDLPPKYFANFNIIKYDGKAQFIECRIEDISAGGLKIVIPKAEPVLKIGDVLRGALRLGNRRPMELDIEVRFAQSKDEAGVKVQVAGVQFKEVDHLLENRLLSLMMDLQRELFLKFPKGK